MRLISWNVNGRVQNVNKQIAALQRQSPDIIALQEVTGNTVHIFRRALLAFGFKYAVDSFESAADQSLLIGPRRYGELTLSHWALEREVSVTIEVPWPERILSANVRTPFGNIDLHNTHIPPGVTNGWIKIETLNGIYKRLAHHTKRMRILCGDFNTPKLETTEGQIITFAKRSQPEWDKGERSILEGLRAYDLFDAYRHQHGYKVSDFSWYARPHIGRRFDHIFAPKFMLTSSKCKYLHTWRAKKLSDHSAIQVDFQLMPYNLMQS